MTNQLRRESHRIARRVRLLAHERARTRALVPALALAIALTTATACSSSTDPTPPPPPASIDWYFPPLTGPTWSTVRPASAGFDSTALHAALDWAGTQNSSAVVVLYRGHLVAERYWNGWTTSTVGPVFSAGKTITSALIGQLAAEGRLSLDAPASTYLGAGWSRTTSGESAITVRHLLSMASGLNDSLQTVDGPGARFYYNNPGYYQLFGVLEAASGLTLNALADDRIFSRIGMSTALAVSNTDTGEPGYIFASSARDFARFGLLVMRQGRWGNVTVLQDSAFLTNARRWSGTDNQSYGWLWWLNGGATHRTPGPYLLPTVSGPLFPTAPSDLVAALGADDKKLYLLPSRDLVIVRLGPGAPAAGGGQAAISGFDNELWARISAAFR